MTPLAHVYAVQVEPDGRWGDDSGCYHRQPWQFDTRAEAEENAQWYRRARGYPSARVVEFELREVKEGS